MSLLKAISKKQLQEIQVVKIRFLGEQDGAPERELRSRLVECFEREGQEVSP